MSFSLLRLASLRESRMVYCLDILSISQKSIFLSLLLIFDNVLFIHKHIELVFV
jgi:hypothetical protein